MQISGNMSASGMADLGNSKANEIKSANLEKEMDEAIKNKDENALKDACKQFESYFVNAMLKEMRKTLSSGENDLIPKGEAEQTFTEMLDSEYSNKSAETGGIGLANMMYKQLSKQMGKKVSSEK